MGGVAVRSGRTSGQEKVAVAVCTVPVVASVASAMMVASPLPKALATPAFDLPCEPELLVVTGKTLGVEDNHVTVLVRSRVVGSVVNVPIARNCPVACRLPTVIALGMMVSERSGDGAGVKVTARDAVAVTTLPSLFVQIAVMVVLPALTP